MGGNYMRKYGINFIKIMLEILPFFSLKLGLLYRLLFFDTPTENSTIQVAQQTMYVAN